MDCSSLPHSLFALRTINCFPGSRTSPQDISFVFGLKSKSVLSYPFMLRLMFSFRIMFETVPFKIWVKLSLKDSSIMKSTSGGKQGCSTITWTVSVSSPQLFCAYMLIVCFPGAKLYWELICPEVASNLKYTSGLPSTVIAMLLAFLIFVTVPFSLWVTYSESAFPTTKLTTGSTQGGVGVVAYPMSHFSKSPV